MASTTVKMAGSECDTDDQQENRRQVQEDRMIEGNAGKYNSEDGRIRVCIDGQIGTT
jgi:hypothetical protein